ncbi:pyridoxal phosphate-dependent decarboxylase family protein [Amycolatopsis cihanbeyliensis]|uniref:Glutamate/tyrosine decarboxylase-like PLP-dependent enzyme n=1 Tax=Amycolatopsis cihanbeyliensis TaxID=1128664 RepID=A0A542DC11_AMYCI|nr:pyridoxal-dependent decarboxylase [Amycolatopsis cihanbeyliensis]TQJ00609.1 glutamate/tyrosine decarboxylase-like PLP-dependent enzyme [Amycolatopsis cihanbeyliensis]
MDLTLAADADRIPALLDTVRDHAGRVLAGLADRPAAGSPRQGPARPLPEHGIGTERALAEFAARWEPGFSASAGPRYLGFVTGGATPAAVAGDWLATAHDQNVAATHDSSATDLERETLRWLGELLDLGTAHSGAFVTGATMSNLVGLAIGREWLGERAGISVAEDGAAALGPVPILSGAAHSSVFKALAMLGLGRKNLRTIPTLDGREAVDPDRLAEALDALDGRPAIVVANAGTVNTVDFDDLRAVAALRERYPFWLHVDGAFGAFAALSPAHEHLVAGLAEADSVCVDLHKWLNVPYDSAAQFTRRKDLQLRVFQNAAAYLGVPADDPAFVHLTPENSRRLRALPAWFALAAYGRQGHREIVERDIALARRLGQRIEELPGLRLLAPVRLNVVCFTLAENPTPERVNALAEVIAADGRAFLTPTEYDGTRALRAAFSNWRTTEADVERIAEAIADAARAVPPSR